MWTACHKDIGVMFNIRALRTARLAALRAACRLFPEQSDISAETP